jgi:hypothetical protein
MVQHYALLEGAVRSDLCAIGGMCYWWLLEPVEVSQEGHDYVIGYQ